MEGNRSYWTVVTRYGTQFNFFTELSHDIWFPPRSAASTGVSALETFKPAAFESACGILCKTGVPSVLTEALRLIPARLVHFQIVPSIIDDGIDRHDLNLACVIEGHHFGLGFVFGHCRDSGGCIHSVGTLRLVGWRWGG